MFTKANSLLAKVALRLIGLLKGANMELTSRIGDTARSLAMKKNLIKIVSLIDNKALSHVSVRTSSSVGRCSFVL